MHADLTDSIPARLIRRRPLQVLAALFTLAAIVAIPATGAAGKRRPERSPPIEARLELAAGIVTLDGREVFTSGAAIAVDTRLGTGPGARALARLSDGASIFLAAQTDVRLGADRVQLVDGELWLDAPPRIRDDSSYQLGDVIVTATDAGLDLRFVDGVATVYVARGLAVVSAPGGRVEVQAGEEATVDGTKAPELTSVTWWSDWTGGMADNRMASDVSGVGAGSLYGVDLADESGRAARDLDVSRMDVRTTIRAGLAETEVDQTFSNSGERDLEGWYWFTVPAGATVTSFAVEHHGVLVEGEFVERQEARAAYGAAVASGAAPAILEWVDGRSFRARIHPVPAMGSRRVVLRYLEPLEVVDGVMRFVYPLQTGRPVRVGEFSLSVDLGKAGKSMELSTLADARIEDGGRRVTMRRSGFVPVADFQLEAKLGKDVKPMRVARFDSGSETADYVMMRYSPKVDWDSAASRRADVVVVVDTSAAGDSESRALKFATAEAVLRALSSEDRFALMALDVESTVLHPAEGLAAAEPEQIAQALERLADHSHGGATDLADFFDVALSRLHGGEQPAVVYIGDGHATSGELTGDQLRERLRRTLATSPARLFTVAAGNDANATLLEELARTGGGQSLRVGHADEATERALRLASALKTPTITGLQIDGGAALDDVLVSGGGKVSYGGEVTLLARTHHPLPRTVRVTGRLGGKPFERSYKTRVDDDVAASFVPRFWAHERMRRTLGSAAEPSEVRGEILRLGLDYGLMTPFSSILVLENEAAYTSRGIQRSCSPMRGLRLASLDNGGRVPAGVSNGCRPTGMAEVTGAVAARRVSETVTIAAPRPGSPKTRRSSKDAPEPAYAEDSRDYDVELESAPTDDYDEAQAAGGLLGSSTGLRGDGGGLGGGRPLGHAGTGLSHKSDGDRSGPKRERSADPTPPTRVTTPGPRPEPIVQTRISYVASCSDWARRPLQDRIVVWKKRFRTAGPGELLDRYYSARAACELPDWRSEAAFLRLLASRVEGEAQATAVLAAFERQPDTRRWVARLILRGTVDPHLVTAIETVLFGDRIDWEIVDLKLAEIEDLDERIERLRSILVTSPEDSRGVIRLIRLLAAADRLDELLVQSRRLQERGIMTPLLAREVGDVLASRGMDAEAVRAYSEIVEFNPGSLHTRKLLGDIYLAHGWYEQAYRQYASIDRASPNRPEILLRLATAATGQGRVDEALRIERRVASAPGNPGPDDPRHWARLLSASRIADLLEVTEDEQRRDGMRRALKELQHFRAPGTLVLLSWRDLTAELELGAEREGHAVAVGDPTDAAAVGVAAVLLPPSELHDLDLSARLRGLPRGRSIDVTLHTITWGGEDFEVVSETKQLEAGETSVKL